jgi:hypothetical protein
MSRIFKSILGAAALALLAPTAGAFTPLGIWDTWQTTRMHYNLPTDIGGPMNINEEYRYNVPVLYYAFDDTFLSYFGQKGVEEVEKAIAIINALPPMSSVDIGAYPVETRRVNSRAQTLALLDLKSVTLGTMMELMGLAEAPRYVFCLREVVDADCCNAFTVIRRNFDPFTGRPTSYINDTLWTYTDILCSCTPVQDAFTINRAVDPLALTEPVANFFGMFSKFGNGQFYTTLSRDDIGALRHIYRRGNQNYESVIPGVSGNGAGGTWGIPGTSTNNFITNAVRFGIDKVTFVRVDFDSMLGELFSPITNRWTEQIITNGVVRDQQLTRAVVLPDLVFSGADITPFAIFRGTLFTRNPVLNGTVTAGPGILSPNITLNYNTVGPQYINFNGSFVAETNGIPRYTWGAFDSSTNIAIFPYYESVDAIEAKILGSTTGSAGGPFSLPPVQFNFQALNGGAAGGNGP